MSDWDDRDEVTANDLNIAGYDARCQGCGAIFVAHPPQCDLCGGDIFEPVEDLAW